MAEAHAIAKERDNCRACKCLLDVTERAKGVCDQCEKDDRDDQDADDEED